MENPIAQLKEIQKKLVEEIKSNHNESDSYTFRHNHIAYCELRGRQRQQIEVPREGNEPSEYLISKIKKEWLDKIAAWREEDEKTVCDCD